MAASLPTLAPSSQPRGGWRKAPRMRGIAMPWLDPCTAAPPILRAGLLAHCGKAAEQQEVRGRQKLSLDIGTSLCGRKSSISLGVLLGKDMIEGKRVEVCATVSDTKVDRDECCL